MRAWSLGRQRNADRRTATELYGSLVAWARSPALYALPGVADSPETRLELILLHMALMLRRIATEGPGRDSLARALTETFVTDIDDCLREMGVSDLSVAKKVKRAAAALYDRCRDYQAALADRSDDALQSLIRTHLLGGEVGGHAGAILAAYARTAAERLRQSDLAAIIAGRIALAPPDGAEGSSS